MGHERGTAPGLCRHPLGPAALSNGRERRAAPLLLLHFSSGSSRVYRRLMPQLAGYRTIAPDLPGLGESAPLPAQVTMEEVTGNVVALLDNLGIARTHVFGLNSGNKLAVALAAGRPDRVDRLVVAGMTHSLVVDAAQRRDADLCRSFAQLGGHCRRRRPDRQAWKALARTQCR